MVKRVVAIALVVVLVLAFAAYAQNQPKPVRPAKQKPVVGGFAGRQVAPKPDPGDRLLGFYRMMYLQRYLLPPGRGEIEKLAIAMGLTEEQKQKIRELHMQFVNTAKPFFEQKAAATKEVLDLLQGPSPNKGALQAAANKVSQAESAILDAEFDFWLAFRSILNPQQQQSFSQFMQQKAVREMGGARQPRPGQPALPPAP